MSQSDAAFRYLSWLRRGAAAQIAIPDGEPEPAQVSLPVSLSFAGVAQPVTVDLDLLGPGDITGFDGRAVKRVWPPAARRTMSPQSRLPGAPCSTCGG